MVHTDFVEGTDFLSAPKGSTDFGCWVRTEGCVFGCRRRTDGCDDFDCSCTEKMLLGFVPREDHVHGGGESSVHTVHRCPPHDVRAELCSCGFFGRVSWDGSFYLLEQILLILDNTVTANLCRLS